MQGMPPLHALRMQALHASALFPNELSGALSLEGVDRNRITELALAQLSASGRSPLPVHGCCAPCLPPWPTPLPYLLAAYGGRVCVCLC